MTTESTALAIAPPQAAPMAATSATLAFEPSDMMSAFKLAEILVNSRLLPRAVSTPEAAFTIIMAGREMGLTAMQSLRSIHVIEGKPTMSADLMVALVKRSPTCRFFTLIESTNDIATYETQRVGEANPTRLSFTSTDAKMAQLTGKDNYKKFPAAMLRARASAALCRAVYPDIMLGVYDTDEIAPAPQQMPTVTVVPPNGEGPTRWESAVQFYIDNLENCNTPGEIDKLSAGAAKEGFTGEYRTRVAEAFSARRAAIAPAPAVVVVEAPVVAEATEAA